MDNKERKNQYPLTGFSKISYEEFLGMLEMMKLFSGLSSESKDIVLLIMDGMKFRANPSPQETREGEDE